MAAQMSCSSASESSEVSSGSSSDSVGNAVSILDKLHAPRPSDLSRKRKIHANPPEGKRRSTTQAVRKFDPQTIKPSQRVSEFPGEHLRVSLGKLFCNACRETLTQTQCCATAREVKKSMKPAKKPKE